ncbi:MAG: hypothetical protein R8M14_09595 [Ghiorsea sp.]
MEKLFPIFILSMFIMGILYTQGFKTLYIIKTCRLLMWLFIPILLFHGLFTPGTMLQQPIYLPLSVEGLERGLFLCAHLAFIFFSVLMLFRVFSQAEWRLLNQILPESTMVKTHISLLYSMKYRVVDVLQMEKRRWVNGGGHWKMLPELMVLSIVEVISLAKVEGKNLWQDWSLRMYPSEDLVIPFWSRNEMIYIVYLTLGWMLFWLI